MKKKIAVLHAQVPFVQGGAENLVKNLTMQLCQRGFDAEIISLPFKWYPNNTLFDSSFMWRMIDLEESNGMKIDLVIALKFPTYLIKHSNKVLWLMHQHRVAYDLQDNVPAGGFNTVPGGQKMMKLVQRMDNLTIPEAKSVYSISRNVSTRLKKYNNIDSKPLYHPPSLIGKYYLGDFENYILSVGRLDANKRVELLIRSLKYCDKNIRVKIAGKGNEDKNLRILANRLQVSDRVDFLGFVSEEDILKLYANALAVCYPPIDEDYGYVTLEAFLSGKPVLTCQDSGGVLEFVRQEENGFVVPYNEESMGMCFQKLYQDKKLARAMGHEGYETVKNFSWDSVINELTKTIQ